MYTWIQCVLCTITLLEGESHWKAVLEAGIRKWIHNITYKMIMSYYEKWPLYSYLIHIEFNEMYFAG